MRDYVGDVTLVPKIKAIGGVPAQRLNIILAWFCATVCKTVRPVLSDRCLHCLCVCLSYLSVTLVYCGQTVGCIKVPLGTKVGLDPGHTVLDGDPAPTKKGKAPNFRPMSVVAKCLDGSRCHLVQR